MKKHQIVIYRGEANKTAFNAHVQIDDHLIVDWGGSIEELEGRIRNLVKDQYPDQDFDFEISYDLSSFFERFKFLNISQLAKVSGINASTMRQYARGLRYPSIRQARKIEKAIHQVGKEMSEVVIHAE